MNARIFHCCLGALLLTGCARHENSAVRTDRPPLPVRVAVVSVEQFPVFLEVPATVRPAERAIIASKLTGTVETFPLGLGQAVAAGDVLLTLSAPETEARLRQARAQLAEATRAAERERALVAKGAAAPDAQRDADDRLRIVQASAAEAEAMLSYATVRAPFAGVITEKYLLVGDLATPGLPLLVLESTAHLRAEGAIPENAATGLRLGTPLAVAVEDGAAFVTGHIEEISGAADPVSRSIRVKVALPEGSARSGQFARLRVSHAKADTLLVPASAVTRFGQMERIFVLEQGRALLRLVKTGRGIDDRIEILAGLNAGEQVVLSPPAALRDGQPVTITP